MPSWVWLRLWVGQFPVQDLAAIGVEGNRHFALDAVVSDALHQQVNEPGLLRRRQRLPGRRAVASRVRAKLPDLVHDQLLNRASGDRGRRTALPAALLGSGTNVIAVAAVALAGLAAGHGTAAGPAV